MKIRFGGVDFDTASEADCGALQRRIDESEKTRTDESEKIETLERSNGELQGKLDAATERAEKAEASVADAVASELKFRADHAKLLPEGYDFEGKDRRAVKLDAIRHRNPKASILADENASDGAIDGYLMSLTDRGEDYQPKADADAEDKADAKSENDKIREDYEKKLRGDSSAFTRAALLGGKN